MLVEPGREKETARLLTERFEPRIPDAITFALENRVLLLRVASCDVDLSFGIPGYEDEVVANAGPLDIGAGREVFVCSLEDLIIHKAIAGRQRDREDIEHLIERNRVQLDVAKVRMWLREFSQLLESDEPLRIFEDLM
ncbi:MAG: nucleotidyltransferase [Armatimonadetes bacterium]|nr:nucleotidyltransferase [Armatimonadota bacterium]